MEIAIGADHAGFELKEQVKAYLVGLKHQVVDLGTNSTEPVDYPDFVEALCLTVRDGKAERGILHDDMNVPAGTDALNIFAPFSNPGIVEAQSMGETGSILYRVANASVGTGADFCARSVVTHREKAGGSSRRSAEGALESKWTALRGGKSAEPAIVA